MKYRAAKFACEKCSATLAVIGNDEEYNDLKHL